MIELKNIGLVFNEKTLDEHVVFRGFNLTIERGDFVVVVGSNGAGKSALLNLIAGHYKPQEGRMLLDGKEITRESEHKRARRIGRIFQDPLVGTAGSMFVEHNLLMAEKKGLRGLRISLSETKRRHFFNVLKNLEMGLEKRMRDNVEVLSGGQRQALTLLMATLSKPEILLIDEHTAALDPANAHHLMELTRLFLEEFRLTALMVTHNMKHALQYGNRLLLMDRGQIILDLDEASKKNVTPQELSEKFL